MTSLPWTPLVQEFLISWVPNATKYFGTLPDITVGQNAIKVLWACCLFCHLLRPDFIQNKKTAATYDLELGLETDRLSLEAGDTALMCTSHAGGPT